MNKKIWRDRNGAISPLAITIALIVVVAVVLIAVLAAMPMGETRGGQGDKDKDGDGEPDPIIGYLKVAVEMEMDNGAWLGGFDYSILSVSANLVDEPSTMSILDGMMSLFETDQNFKLVIIVTFPIEDQTIVSENQGTIEFSYEIGGTDIERVTKTLCTGGLRYHGAYVVEATLFDESGQVDQMVIDVVV